jgi:hypothetical protein
MCVIRWMFQESRLIIGTRKVAGIRSAIGQPSERPMVRLGAVMLALASAFVAASPTQAQNPDSLKAPTDNGNVKTISVVAGAALFDLAGTGTTPIVGLRADAEFTRWFVGEVGVTAIRPDEQFRRHATYLFPEFQLQLQVPLRLVHPYLGVGAGLASEPASPVQSGTAPTINGAAGVRVLVPGSSATVRAELRVRGIGVGLTGAMADWTIGLGHRF